MDIGSCMRTSSCIGGVLLHCWLVDLWLRHMLAGQANMSKSSMHLAYDVCRAEARHIHKVHHEFKAGRVAGPMCWWHHGHSSAESIESCFCGEDGEADEYLSGKDWATEASQAPMGLAAIYCHPLEFFLSDLMYFPQTITVPSTTATNPFSREPYEIVKDRGLLNWLNVFSSSWVQGTTQSDTTYGGGCVGTCSHSVSNF